MTDEEIKQLNSLLKKKADEEKKIARKKRDEINKLCKERWQLNPSDIDTLVADYKSKLATEQLKKPGQIDDDPFKLPFE